MSAHATSTAARLEQRFDSPWVVMTIALALWSIFLAGWLSHRGNRISTLITAGDQFVDSHAVPSPIAVEQHSAGYDGQFYYRLSIDPFTPERREFGVKIDNPPWRQQRIGYPLLVWLLSFGQPRLVPVMMALLNLLSLALLGWLGGWIARRLGGHALWGLAVPLYAGFAYSFVRDLAEIMEAAFVVLGIALVMARKPLFAACALSYALLVKELAVVVAAMMLLVWVWKKLRREETSLRWFAAAIPLAVFAAWHITLRLRWGIFPSRAGSADIGTPFVAFADFARDVVIPGKTHVIRMWRSILVMMIAVAAMTVASLRRSRIGAWVKLSWVSYFVLVATFTRAIWSDDFGFMRALAEFHVMAALVALGAPPKLRNTTVLLLVVLWFYTTREMLKWGS